MKWETQTGRDLDILQGNLRKAGLLDDVAAGRKLTEVVWEIIERYQQTEGKEITVEEAEAIKRTHAGWQLAFQIFGKYQKDRAHIAAEHDQLWAGPDPAIVSDEDIALLDALGWFPCPEDCFKRLT